MPVTLNYIRTLLETIPLMVYYLLGLLVIIVSVLTFYQKGIKQGGRYVTGYLLCAYVVITMCTTVIFRQTINEPSLWRPLFWSYYIIDSAKENIIEENVMNVVAFLPIGALIAMSFNKLRWYHATLFGLLLSTIIEILQYSLKRGQFEFDDVFNNTLGCLIGYLIIKGGISIYKFLRQQRNDVQEREGLNIFGIQESKEAKEFVMKNGSLEIEVFAEIIKQTKDVPYIESLFKLGKVAVNIMDYWFVRKLRIFLEQSENLDVEKKERFLKDLSAKDYKRIGRYLTQLLYSTDEEGKAELMGKIYKSRLLDEIDNEMMLRLCSVVNNSFLSDLDYLEDFVSETGRDDYISDNLNALGLLQDKGNMYKDKNEDMESLGFGSTKHQLNVVGRELLRIKES